MARAHHWAGKQWNGWCPYDREVCPSMKPAGLPGAGLGGGRSQTSGGAWVGFAAAHKGTRLLLCQASSHQNSKGSTLLSSLS